ncbi:uncharacterized protein LOC112903846 [Agrilus planipennis]|uniref:Uncharacterized protein LOC112903846 n=1 Tax=Agrilus planipennis TaxID=224129 RepID=A0A7F5R7P8_AGRPL|nr:uncharacterized protein LOC112903846 [Agrilus planipennis]
MEISKSTTKETEKLFFPDTVGDITNSCQLCINPSDGIRILEEKTDDLASQHPPPECFSNDYKLFSSSKSGDKVEGLGDHGTIQDGKQHGQYATTEVCPTPRMVEKKSRLTDLVKNSPQVISEYLKADEDTKKKQDEWERMQESVLRVIELECIKPGEEPKVVPPQKYEPEKIALPEDGNEDDLLSIPPKEENMEDVDLNRASTSSDNKPEEIMGDVCTIMSCPRRKKDTCSKPESTGSLQKDKRKKASFLTKFFNFFRKGKNSSQKDVREDYK